MTDTSMLHFLIFFVVVEAMCEPHVDVTVTGATLGPGFNRMEGRGMSY